MRLVSEMTDEEKKYITPKTIASSRMDITESEVIARIEYLLEKQKKELTECFTEEDYAEFYNSAKEAWRAGDMSVRGCTKEIKESMTLALDILGIKGIKTKADFLKVPKSKVDMWTLCNQVTKVILGC